MPDAVGFPAPQPPDLTGQTLGDYRLMRRLGQGGMGQVYLARQLSLKRDVAIKLLRNDLNSDRTALKRFQVEAEAIARLSHANIVQVYAVGEHEGRRYMVLEYVDGRNLREYLDRKGPPDLPVTLSIIRQVAAALDRAHEHGIVHRDIKPENILVTRKVEVKVTDFGLSRYFTSEDAVRLTDSGAAVGTPLYISPEQAQGHSVDHRSDLYSLGVTCYHLLSGEPPFKGRTGVEVALKHVTDEPVPLAELRPDLPPELCALVHKLMAKNPNARFQSAKDVVRELTRIREGRNFGSAAAVSLPTMPTIVPGQQPLTGAGSQAGRPGTSSGSVPQLGEPVRVWPWVVGGLLLLLAAAVGSFTYGLIHDPPGASAGDPATDPHAATRAAARREREQRERDLLIVLTKSTTAEDTIAATVGLGLLHLKDQRLAEAEARFAELERPGRFTGRIADTTARTVGRFGHAVVLSQANRAEESNQVMLDAITTPLGAGKGNQELAVRAVLVQYPDLAQAVCEALNRNATNLRVARLNPTLEPFRSPRWILQGSEE